MFPTFGPDTGGSAFDPALLTTALGLEPQSVMSSGNGTGRDFNTGSGKCFATQIVGSLTAGTIDGKIQESTDNSFWTDVAAGAFTQVSSANNIQTIGFNRTKRYLRYAYTIGGGIDQLACVLFSANQ